MNSSFHHRHRFLAVSLLLATSVLAESKPVHVLVLARQSNMQGHAKVSTFEHIGLDPATKPMLAEMPGTDGKPFPVAFAL